MTTTFESDLKELLGEIKQQLHGIQKDVTELKVSQTEIRGDIKVLDEKITGIGKRLENQEFIGRSIFVGIIFALLVGAVKLLFSLPNSP
ncbi:MAG: hypothetical protein VKJ02_17900 [Snowella sp.]|nr:hypothetical protein [Snowella sp.]